MKKIDQGRKNRTKEQKKIFISGSEGIENFLEFFSLYLVS